MHGTGEKVEGAAEIEEAHTLTVRNQGVGIEHVVMTDVWVREAGDNGTAAQPGDRLEGCEDNDIKLHRTEFVQIVDEGVSEQKHQDEQVTHELHQCSPEIWLVFIEVGSQRAHGAADSCGHCAFQFVHEKLLVDAVEHFLGNPAINDFMLLRVLPTKPNFLWRQQSQSNQIFRLELFEPRIQVFVRHNVDDSQVSVAAEGQFLSLYVVGVSDGAAYQECSAVQSPHNVVAIILENTPSFNSIQQISDLEE
mmetsp:Transcript_56756/g.83289  ORF Transcript_56756/g.83289 Transcript_56756/m.83289 type:complete len:250 (+) Transcript_56756:293-1042(+)